MKIFIPTHDLLKAVRFYKIVFNKMKKNFVLLFLFLYHISNSLALEQHKDSLSSYTIDEVRIVSQLVPSTIKSATPLQVVTQAQMERIGITSVSDAVRRFSGVMVKDYGGIGGLKTVSVRGLGDQNTGIMYDGMSFNNSQSGAIDIGRFSLENVSFISLNIGQSDDIFQPASAFASASVLNIKTEKPVFMDHKIKGQARVATGSWGLFNPSAFLAYQLSPTWAATINGSWQRADGNYHFLFNNGQYDEKRKRYNSDVNNWRTEANVYGDLKNAGKLQFKTSLYDSNRGIPGSVVSVNTEANERIKDRDFFSQLSYENELNTKFSIKGAIKYSRLYSKYTNININQSNNFQLDKYTQNEYYASASLLYKPLDVLSFSLAQDYGYNNLRSNFVLQQSPSRNTSLTALNAQLSTARFTTTATLLATYIGEEVKTGDKPKDKKRLSPAISFSYKPIDLGLRFRASYKDIYRIPTFNEMYYFKTPKITLRPEISKQYNVGATYIESFSDKFSSFTISVDGYINKVKDKIVTVAAAPLVMSLANLDNVTIRGIDISSSAQINITTKYNLMLSGTYSYQSSKNDKTKLQTPYTPEHSGSGAISFENPWINVSYSFIASGKIYSALDHTSQNRMNSYFDHSVSVNRNFAVGKTNLRLQAEILNLSNKNYEIIRGYPMPGRSFRISTNLIF